MNDVFDEGYIKDIVKQILNPKNSPLFSGSLFDRNFITDKPQYVFSTSFEKDASHQWLSYGKNNPICIEFDKDKLIEYLAEYSKIDCVNGIYHYKNYFFSSNVIYDKDEVMKNAERYIPPYRDEWNKELDNVTSALSSEFTTAYLNFHNFYSCAKQENFYAEKEYRFLIYSKNKPEFRSNGGRLISYLKVHMEDKKLPITGIILSPYTSDDAYNNTIRKFLDNNKYDSVVISPSELHLR